MMPAEAERRSSTIFEPTRPAAQPAISNLIRAPGGLDWQAFSAVYFPERRRHDLEALVAYGAYRRSHSGAALSSDERTRIGPGRDANGARALRNWENEGGATLSPHGP
jgi:hypothetical protein